ncbi:MAG: hypothetical protein IJJ23_03550 [Clostridia bacterium]|nr:hypothetical protein [Clostridia bacterium]
MAEMSARERHVEQLHQARVEWMNAKDNTPRKRDQELRTYDKLMKG